MAKHIHIHVGNTRDADPQIVQAKKDAEQAIKAAMVKCTRLASILKDRDDRSQVNSAVNFLKDAHGKIQNEVLSGIERE